MASLDDERFTVLSSGIKLVEVVDNSGTVARPL
jgi:hypothetical protein